MKVLILGADGYLGWPTTMYFSNKGCEVCAVDNLSKKKNRVRIWYRTFKSS